MSDMWEIVVFIPAAVLRREREGEEARETVIETETQTNRDTIQTYRQRLINNSMITYKNIKILIIIN